MTSVVSNLFGGGNKKAEREAKKQQEESRQLQRVANDRQLADVNRNKQAIGANRRAPRGRRLYEEDVSSASGSSTVLA